MSSQSGSPSSSPLSSPPHSPPPSPPPPSSPPPRSPLLPSGSPPPPSRSSGQVFSPPPPARKLSPSTYHSPSPSTSSNSSDISPSSSGNSDVSSRTELSVPTIIGIAAGAGLLLLVMILLIAFRKRKQSSQAPIRYYTNHDNDFFKRTKPPNQQQWNNGDVVLNIPPATGVVPVGGGWAAGTSPRAPMHSVETSSSHSSGQQAAMAVGFNKSSFTLDELSIATNGFAQENLLGQGGFGYVHKGVLPNGKEIAVKGLKSSGGQGDREFQAEVDIISRVHHRHLVSLVGYCISSDKKLLVYEFVPNKTLEYHLHGKGRPVMDWGTRLKLAIGAAKGLAYLHEGCHPRIIHRDIKGPNILIDSNFEAKVADFGLAKFTHDNHTHVSTRVMGTFGYLAPEYASSGKLTDKSDVFSYGIVLLELITGRPPVDTSGQYGDDSLVEWARPLCLSASENGRYEELVDPRLENNYDKNEMAHMVTCAAACVRHSARKRPKMSQIVRALEGDVSVSLDDPSEGVKPGKSSILGINASNSIEYDAGTYSADMRRFRKLALESSESTCEYGLNPSTSSSDSSCAYGSGTSTKLT